MINHGLVKKNGKVTGYRSEASQLKTAQMDRFNELKQYNKNRLNHAEGLLDAWACWMLKSGYGHASLVNISTKDFTNLRGPIVPMGVEMTKNATTTLQIFGSMTDANQLSYVAILRAVHLARDDDRSIERVIKKLQPHGFHDFHYRKYKRAKSAFAGHL